MQFLWGGPRISRLGLLLAPKYPPEHYQIQPQASPPPLIQTFLWADSALLQRPIWDRERLTMRTFEGNLAMQPHADIHPDMNPYEALIWAYDTSELRNVKRLTVYSVISGWGERRVGDVSEREFHKSICNMRVDFEPASGIASRFTRRTDVDNTEIPDADAQVFEIDGPGGEYICEISARKGLHLDSLKVSPAWPRHPHKLKMGSYGQTAAESSGGRVKGKLGMAGSPSRFRVLMQLLAW